ncbi:hypothetical protein MGL_3383 [Malassezia globosa CBS 7966]|uniref:intramembrane prenyl-peptidase Rce1 n=1 Tax=Malassezia globosa (strain ATCC MYA-4612 / CBS 7966) TaxID=425265 RepID=A8Q905_MALGO|nr:uncharacterized protein MGL_3383 [Malassezia globosa CBS 7966]EDP42134.1 hypothetical protein MGL_3383 [Malassezia globosa CBS 7966]
MPEPTFLTSQFFPFNPSVGVFLGRIGWICAQSLMLTSCLYIGTFFAKLLDHLSSQRESKSPEPRDTWLQCLRNYIIGPCTEELVFRSCMLTSIQHLNPHVSKATLMLTPPLYFGIAHIHHAWESLKQGGFTKRAGRLAFQSSALQFTYTSVFGWYADFLFMRTGTVWAPLTAHILCNVMGLPKFSTHRNGSPMKYIQVCAHLTGFALFIISLMPLTSTSAPGSLKA